MKEILTPTSVPAVTDPYRQSSYKRSSGPGPDLLSEESLKSIMENYLRYYASGTGHTARAKRYDLQYFLEFLSGHSSRETDVTQVYVADWTLQKTQAFLDHRLSLGESPATVSRRLASIKHFGRTLAERVPGYINPAREVKAPVQQSTRPSGLTRKEIQALQTISKTMCSKTPTRFNDRRDHFLLELLLATGLRADEVRVLVMAQISEDLAWLKNVKTKGRKFRNVYLDTEIRAHLRHYLEDREKELLEKFPGITTLSASEKAKFPVLVSFYRASLATPSSFSLSPKTIWRVIATIGRKAQAHYPALSKRLHPHLLRHTFAHGLLDSSKDVRLVAQALGHSDVRVTMRYTERTQDEVARAIEKKLRHPK